MSWESIYQERQMSAADAVTRFVKSGDNIFMGGLVIASHVLDEIVRKVKGGDLKNMIIYSHFIRNDMPLADPELTEDKLRYRCFFVGPKERDCIKAGSGTYVPLRYTNFCRYMENEKPALAIMPMTPPDENGYCNIGPCSAGYGPPGIRNSKKIIAQINPKLPRAIGMEADYHVKDIAAFVHYEEEMPPYVNPEPTDVDYKIAQHIVERVEDGSTIQLGIGGMANAIGFGLRGKKHLGIHSEMFTESMTALMKEGVIDNSQKTFQPGKSIVGFTLGSKEHYEFVHNNKDLLFCPYEYVNDVNNIKANDKMVSINNAISIDLTGQICAESIGHRQFSGTGGQVDYVRGATTSKGGKSFIAVSAVANTKQGPTSRIVIDFEPGSVITSLRTEVQYIVTEFGCVDLQFCDIPTRAKRLISIAHPDFRDELTFKAKKVGYIY